MRDSDACRVPGAGCFAEVAERAAGLPQLADLGTWRCPAVLKTTAVFARMPRNSTSRCGGALL